MTLLKRLNKEIPTIFFLLTLVGYELVASLFMPTVSIDVMTNEEESAITQVYSIPYRALYLLITLYILFYYRARGKTINTVNIFTIYYSLWIIRLLHDWFFFTECPIGITPRLMIMVGTCYLSIFAIRKAYWYIDVNRIFKILIILQTICVVGLIVRNPLFLLTGNDIDQRADGSLGLSTISTAGMAMASVMMAIFGFMNPHHKLNVFTKIILAIIIVLSILVGFRASSRGPIVSFAIVFVFYLFCISKNPLKGVTISIASLILLFLFKEQLLDLIGSISPILKERFLEEGGSALQRQEMAQKAIDGFINNPIFGYAYGVEFEGVIGYPHNTILEAFNGLGLIGGLIYLLLIFYASKASYEILHSKDKNGWICLLLMISIVESMFSSNFYNNGRLSILWVFVFLYYHTYKINRRGMQYTTSKQ